MNRLALASAACVALTGLAAVPSQQPAASAAPAKRCAEPAAQWQQVTPAAAGMDATKLQAAIDAAVQGGDAAVRVYRHGCLVASDRGAPVNQHVKFESWSMAKSITAMVFGRAWTRGQISPSDPLGSLVKQADYAHGDLTVQNLLTQTSGLNLNPVRDYNILTPDRLKSALKTEIDFRPGTTFGYSQMGPALLAEAVQRAVGEDFQAFAQRELFGPIGIQPGSWYWRRDPAGHTQGFFGMNMRPGDYARLGELLRRGGVWNGRRLLSREFMRQALTPNSTNGCHGWLIWLNRAKPCFAPTSASPDRYAPGLPADLYTFSGLLGQHVTVLPTQGIVVVEAGAGDVVPLPGEAATLWKGVLDSVTDQTVKPPAPARAVSRPKGAKFTDPDQIARVLFNPQQSLDPILVWLGSPLPPAGPARARAAYLRGPSLRATERGVVRVGLRCASRWPAWPGPQRCRGTARLLTASSPPDAAPSMGYDVAPGGTRSLSFKLTPARLRALCRTGTLTLTALVRNRDRAQGVPSSLRFVVRRPTRC